MADDLDDLETKMHVLATLGDARQQLGESDEAVQSYGRALEIARNEGNEIGIIAYGTSHHAVVETLDQLQTEYGIKADYLRLRAYPFTRETHEFVAGHKRVYVIDQNRDRQMYDVLRLEIADPAKLRSIRHYDGFPLDAETVLEGIEAGEKK